MRGVRVFLVVVLCLYAGWWWHTPSNEPQRPHSLHAARMTLDYLSLARSYPAQEVPEVGFQAGFEHAKDMPRAHAKHNEGWTPLGPTNIGGRTLAVAVDPNAPETVYAGSAGGGLWRSTTGGLGPEAWEPVRTGFPVLAVAAIAIAREQAGTIYIGTGEMYGSDESHPGISAIRTTRGSYGIGILKSTDGGTTWTKSLDWSQHQRRGVQRIAINPLRPASVWAATTDGVYRSWDAGTTWARAHDVVMATDLVINAEDTTRLFAAHGGMGSPGHGIYRSIDGGDTWDKQGIVGPNFSFQGKARLAISASDPDIVMASIGRANGRLNGFPGAVSPATWLVRTENGGETWITVSQVDYAAIQGWYSHTVAIHPDDPNIVWTSGQPFSAFYSDFGGRNLRSAEQQGLFIPANPATNQADAEQYPHLHTWADHHDIVFHPSNPDIIFFANDGGVFRSDDGGRTLQNANGGYQTTQFFNGVSVSDTDPRFMLGGLQDNNSVIYEGQPAWRRAFGGDGGWTAMNQADNNTIYLSYQWGNIQRFLARGYVSNNSIRPPSLRNTDTNFITPYVLSPVDNRTMYFGAERVWRSSDEGNNWSLTNDARALDGNGVVSMAASHQDVNTVYVATSAKVTRPNVFGTRDGGTTWINMTENLPDRMPTDLFVDPNDDRRIYVTLGGFGTPHLYRSTDGGGSWTPLDMGLPDLPAWSVTVDPAMPHHLYMGNEIGVFASTDDGASWYPLDTGLPDAIHAMDLVVSKSNRMLRVATHGHGVWEIPLATAQALATESNPPTSFSLAPVFPNPVAATATLPLMLHERSTINVTLFDMTGREIRNVVHGSYARGTHHLHISTDGLSNGTYLLRAETSNQQASQTITVLR